MPRNFVLAFGGTGARCAEAFTYLLASRAVSEPCHILVIDPDQDNGNVGAARAQLQRYQALRKELSPATSDVPFFNTPVNDGRSTFFWSNTTGHLDWRSSLNYPALNESTRELLNLLYDESDLDMTFEEGYVGRAHIGSLDLLQTLRRCMLGAKDKQQGEDLDALEHFYTELRAATQGGERPNLVVLGSIFGGTGASGLPAMPPLLRETLGAQLAARVNIGCVQVAPYFSFPDGTEGNPDSTLHPLATQTAMRHYALTDVGYDRIYLVGGPERVQTSSANRRGGRHQRNVAHHIELSAALGAAHFFAEPPASMPGGSSTELVASNAQDLSWSRLPYSRDVGLRENLVSLATFCLSHAHFFGPDLKTGNLAGSLFDISLRRKAGRELGGHEQVLDALTEFSKRYLEWIGELREHSGEALFTLDSPVTEDSALRVAPGGQSKGRPMSDIRERLDKEAATLAKKERDVQSRGVGFYIDVLTRTVDGFCANNYSTWS